TNKIVGKDEMSRCEQRGEVQGETENKAIVNQDESFMDIDSADWFTRVTDAMQYAKLLPLALIHMLGNVFTNMSLGKVVVSFTHTIKAMEPFFSVLLSILFLGEDFAPTPIKLFKKGSCNLGRTIRFILAGGSPIQAESHPRPKSSLQLTTTSHLHQDQEAHAAEVGPTTALFKAKVPWSSQRGNLSEKQRVFKTVKGWIPSLPVLGSLVPIVGGVVLASMTEVSFNWIGFWSAMTSNLMNQSRNVYSKKILADKEVNLFLLHDSLDDINLFSIITVMTFLLSAPLMLCVEGIKFSPPYLQNAGVNVKELFVRAALAGTSFYFYQQ
ncbi:hypothetical protein ACJX0J_041973, partial [Zea mays]